MRILVTGGTGLVGRALCQRLAAGGDSVVVLSRSPSSVAQRVPEAEAAFGWATDGSLVPGEALEGVDAVVHLAGETVSGRWTASKRAAIRDSRVDGTRALVRSLAGLPQSSRPSVLVSASAVGFYGDRGDEELNEESESGTGFLAEICRAWEAEARAAEELGIRVVRLRLSMVLAQGGGALAEMLPAARMGLGGRLGTGRQWWSWIHREDLVDLVGHVLRDNSISGVLNGSCPGAVRQVEFTRSLAAIFGRPAFIPAPAWAIKLALGGFSAEVLTSKLVRPVRTLETGFRFSFEELEPALREILRP
ncbi:MAG: TIGR01777 family oxidoreductase [Myxococcota bacterium]|nr:TIGR01777 family oxidoreductase [Myxococcota bacterium]